MDSSQLWARQFWARQLWDCQPGSRALLASVPPGHDARPSGAMPSEAGIVAYGPVLGPDWSSLYGDEVEVGSASPKTLIKTQHPCVYQALPQA